jgi:hypothetical protein
LTLAGNANLGGNVANVSSLNVSGSTRLGGNVSSTGAQTYTGAVTLGADSALTGVAIMLGGTVKSDGTNRSLTINDSGTTTLAGAIGGSTDGEKLSSLTTNAGGSTLINGGSVRTTGAQTYGDAVTLGADTTLTGVGITLGSTVKSSGGNRSLTINDSGSTTLAGAVGSVTAGEKLSSITTDAAGTTAINGVSITTTGVHVEGNRKPPAGERSAVGVGGRGERAQSHHRGRGQRAQGAGFRGGRERAGRVPQRRRVAPS